MKDITIEGIVTKMKVKAFNRACSIANAINANGSTNYEELQDHIMFSKAAIAKFIDENIEEEVVVEAIPIEYETNICQELGIGTEDVCT